MLDKLLVHKIINILCREIMKLFGLAHLEYVILKYLIKLFLYNFILNILFECE